ncbi:hypothetical protein N0V84_004184 [Fusarium piperis]|uniref:VOC domain-containing protein n=1 Tax=Fusarium piperis TaxID=1435070 RepID=A0A9W8WG17_9HYPO|nr:hypothetical protein N0V84_004184 [Fusarium piperis]
MVQFSFKSSWALLPLLASQALGCGPIERADNDTSEYPKNHLGSDAASDPATIGYNINHLCLNVRNLTASMDFYSRIFGLRELFRLEITESYTIAYMGYSHGGKNGTGYQTALELNREKNNAQGLLELIHIDVPDNYLPSSGEQPNTFGHVGMIVPDIEAAQARLDTFPEVRVLKRTGEALTFGTEVGNATSLSPAFVAQLKPVEQAALIKSLSMLNSPLIYLTDPDGNLVELQPQN